MIAAGRIVDDGNNSVDVTSDDLTIRAGGHVALDTMVATYDVSTDAPGDIYLNEADSIQIESVHVHDGSIIINSVGSIVADSLTSASDSTGNNIAISNQAGSIRVGKIDTGNKGALTLFIGGSVTDWQTDAIDIRAGELSVMAAGSVDLDTQVHSAEITVTKPGEIHLDEYDAITLKSIITFDGRVNVAAGVNGKDLNQSDNTKGITVGTITAGKGGDVTLVAGSIIDEDGDSDTRVSGGSLIVNASGSISLDTNVRSLSATASLGLSLIHI